MLNLVTGLLVIAQADVISRMINGLFFEGEALGHQSGRLYLFLGLMTLRVLSSGTAVYAGNLSAQQVKQDLRRRLFERLLALGPAWMARQHSGEVALSASSGIDALDPFFRDYLPALFMAALLPLAILIRVAPIDPLTFAVLLLTAPLIPFFMALIGRAAGALARRQYGALSRMSAHFLDVLQGLSTLKLFNRSRAQLQTIAAVSDSFRLATMQVLRVAFLSAFTLELLSTISIALVAVEIGLRLLARDLPYQEALFLLVLAPEFYLPLRTLGARFHAGTESTAAAARIFELLGTPAPTPALSPPADARHGGKNDAGHGHPAGLSPVGIRFEGVTLAYDEREALKGLDFQIGPGERIALVGRSGAGKSSAMALLLRFAQPGAGHIWINGQDLQEIDADEWRRRSAYVPQRPSLFSMSVADNIRLGRPEASPDEVIAAAQQAAAHAFIMGLPQGYDTPCGEGGQALSGGQAQRIALARAFLIDAPLLLIDEGTSQLDLETEAEILEALDRLLKNRSALIIAHRLHTIQRMDRIYVLEEGRATGAGSHAELIKHSPAYRALLAGGELMA